MASSGVKILGTTYSPYVNRVLIALNLKLIDYEFVKESMSSKSDLLLKSNPVHQKVPVLIHGDKLICESSIIIQYIDEAWTNSGYYILPTDPYDRSVAQFWAAYFDDKVAPLMKMLVMTQGKERKAVNEQIDEKMVLMEEVFVTCSKGKGYFAGDKIGYIDIVLGSFMGWVKGVEHISGLQVIDETKTPGLFKWSDRFLCNEAVVNVIPKMEKYVALINKMQSLGKSVQFSRLRKRIT